MDNTCHGNRKVSVTGGTELISRNLAARHHLPPIEKYHHSTRDYYWTFLCQTDYIMSKAMEARLLGEDIEQYQEVIEGRRYARQMINAIDDGSYIGPEAGTDIEVYYPPELKEEEGKS